jgi:hypothetical protein
MYATCPLGHCVLGLMYTLCRSSQLQGGADCDQHSGHMACPCQFS